LRSACFAAVLALTGAVAAFSQVQAVSGGAVTSLFGSGLASSLPRADSVPVSVTSVVNGAGFQQGIAAGSWVTIKGENLANTNPGRTWRNDEVVNGNLPTALDGVSVSINNRPAYVYYVSPGQINVQAPSDTSVGPVSVVVTNNGSVSPAGTAQLQMFSPAFFQYESQGTIYAIATRHPDGALIGNPATVSGAVAAKPGDVLILWGTGFGPTNPPTTAGVVVTGAPVAATLPTITLANSMNASVIATALSPGSVGLYQTAITLPTSVPTGNVSIQASVGGVQSPTGIVIFVSN
jgi:uncharacterized protein (TIGR03437 family)